MCSQKMAVLEYHSYQAKVYKRMVFWLLMLQSAMFSEKPGGGRRLALLQHPYKATNRMHLGPNKSKACHLGDEVADPDDHNHHQNHHHHGFSSAIFALPCHSKNTDLNRNLSKTSTKCSLGYRYGLIWIHIWICNTY